VPTTLRRKARRLRNAQTKGKECGWKHFKSKARDGIDRGSRKIILKKGGIMRERQRLLELALKGLEAERLKIDDEIVQIRTQLGHQPSTTN